MTNSDKWELQMLKSTEESAAPDTTSESKPDAYESAIYKLTIYRDEVLIVCTQG